jgi:D-alanyl-D-alanine carboxypeptidase
MYANKRKWGSRLRAGRLILATIITVIVALCMINLFVAFEQNIGSKVMVQKASQPGRKAVDDDNSDYLYIKKRSMDISTGNLILVNNSTPYKFPKESDVISVYAEKNYSYKVSDKSITLDAAVTSHFNEMMSDFEKAKDIHDIIIVSGYRTIYDQKEILDEKIMKLGKAEAEKRATKPGYSEHHTGYALDIGIFNDNEQSQSYTGSGKYSWVNENCKNYGFILRYSGDKAEITGITNEPWHYRYVGIPHAAIIINNNFCLEEYIDYLKNYSFGSKHLKFTGTDELQYEIYYVKATKDITSVPVPRNRKYDISGNNIDGFIVTVKIQAGQHK